MEGFTNLASLLGSADSKMQNGTRKLGMYAQICSL